MLGREFNSKTDFIRAALGLKYPGLGFGGLDEDREDVYSATIELPSERAYRYITAVERVGCWIVVDDFVGPTAYGGATIRIEDKQLVYRTHEHKEFRRRGVE